MELIFRAWHDACEPPDDRPTPDWAAEFLDLSNGGYAIPGFFRVEKSRQLIEPFLGLDDLETRMVSVRAAVQGAKSMLSDVWLPRVLSDRPGPALLAMQTEKIAKDHAAVRLMPNIKNCRPLRRLLPSPKKIRAMDVVFANGVPLYIRGPALGNAQSKSIRYLSIDEAWLLSKEHPGRIYEFLNRTSKYDEIGNSKTLITSQGSELFVDPEGQIIGDDFTQIWHSGTQEHWTIPCLLCGHTFIPKWTLPPVDSSGASQGGGAAPPYRGEKEDLAGMKWDSNGGQVRYECPKCRQAMIDLDSTKAQWNDRGFYTAMNLAAGTRIHHRSFTWTKWISAKWEPLVAKWLRAIQAKRSGVLLPLKEFIQKDGGEDWHERAQITPMEVEIATADFTPGPLKSWPEERFRFMTVDCQANLLLFYVVIRAWSASGESRRIYRGHLESWEEVRKKQVEFGVPSKFTAVDCGYEATKVFRQCCRHVESNGRGWSAFRESDTELFKHHFKERSEWRVYSPVDLAQPILGMGNEQTLNWLATVSPHAAQLYRRGQLRCPVYTWSRPSISDLLAGLRDGKGAPFLGPAEESSEPEELIYRRHMGSEAKELKKQRGGKTERMEWVKKLRDNHYWSCEKMQVVCACLAGVIKLEKGEEAPASR